MLLSSNSPYSCESAILWKLNGWAHRAVGGAVNWWMANPARDHSYCHNYLEWLEALFWPKAELVNVAEVNTDDRAFDIFRSCAHRLKPKSWQCCDYNATQHKQKNNNTNFLSERRKWHQICVGFLMCVWASFSAIPKRNFTHCAINDVSCQFPANNFQWRLAVVSTRSITISLCLGLSVCVCSGVNRSQCHSGGANTHTHTSNTTKLWAGGDMLLLRLWIFCGNTSDVAKKKVCLAGNAQANM